jgi:hypothetical protein
MGVAITFINKSSGEKGHSWHLHDLEDQGRSQQHGLVSRGSRRGKNIETMQPRHLLGKKLMIKDISI